MHEYDVYSFWGSRGRIQACENKSHEATINTSNFIGHHFIFLDFIARVFKVEYLIASICTDIFCFSEFFSIVTAVIRGMPYGQTIVLKIVSIQKSTVKVFYRGVGHLCPTLVTALIIGRFSIHDGVSLNCILTWAMAKIHWFPNHPCLICVSGTRACGERRLRSAPQACDAGV